MGLLLLLTMEAMQPVVFADLSPRQVVLRTLGAEVEEGGLDPADNGAVDLRRVQVEDDTDPVAGGGVEEDEDGGDEAGVRVDREVVGLGEEVHGVVWEVQEVDVDSGARACQIHEKLRTMVNCMPSVCGSRVKRERPLTSLDQQVMDLSKNIHDPELALP